jgi:hypothetical protein
MANEPHTLPPGLYKVRHDGGDDPRAFVVATGRYEGHRVTIPPGLEIPESGDALVQVETRQAAKSNVLLRTAIPIYARFSNNHANEFEMHIADNTIPRILFDPRTERLVITSNGYELIFTRESK